MGGAKSIGTHLNANAMCVVSVRPFALATDRAESEARGLTLVCYCITTSHLMFLAAAETPQDLHHESEQRLAVRKI